MTFTLSNCLFVRKCDFCSTFFDIYQAWNNVQCISDIGLVSATHRYPVKVTGYYKVTQFSWDYRLSFLIYWHQIRSGYLRHVYIYIERHAVLSLLHNLFAVANFVCFASMWKTKLAICELLSICCSFMLSCWQNLPFYKSCCDFNSSIGKFKFEQFHKVSNTAEYTLHFVLNNQKT